MTDDSLADVIEVLGRRGEVPMSSRGGKSQGLPKPNKKQRKKQRNDSGSPLARKAVIYLGHDWDWLTGPLFSEGRPRKPGRAKRRRFPRSG